MCNYWPHRFDTSPLVSHCHLHPIWAPPLPSPVPHLGFFRLPSSPTLRAKIHYLRLGIIQQGHACRSFHLLLVHALLISTNDGSMFFAGRSCHPSRNCITLRSFGLRSRRSTAAPLEYYYIFQYFHSLALLLGIRLCRSLVCLGIGKGLYSY